MRESYTGLTSDEVKESLATHGPNILPEKPPPTDFALILNQLKSPLVYILLVAGAVTFFLKEYSDTSIILFAVLVNTVLGFLQERRASHALTALRKLVHPRALVIRDANRQEIPVEEVVVGDICVVNGGDKVPADGVILDSSRLYVDEALLTGESVPVEKTVDQIISMGTGVVSGKGYFRVEKIGGETQIGAIAVSIQAPSDDTPLRRQLSLFSKQLTYLVLGLISIVFIVGLFSGRGLVEIFETSVALSVSSIPEGLLVGLTVVLALGMQRILRRKGLVRNMVSAETLGGVTTICVDKTGTLTEGSMQVVETSGDTDKLSLQSLVANDLDDPLVIAAYNWGKEYHDDEKMLDKHKRIDDIPFTSESRFFASLVKWDTKKSMLMVNGAPEFLLKWTTISDAQKKDISSQVDEYSKRGMRVIGMAQKKMSHATTSISEKDVHKGLEWVGLLAFSDPVRKGVKSALREAQSAGLKVIVITGDYAQTAVSVMNQLDISVSTHETVLGDELATMTAKQLSEKLKSSKGVMLFARTTPDQKLLIVEALKKNGEVVAMTGDGVNDAPALTRADIGIVVGSASDVAKESADLILLDSSFDTIVAAIEEGRVIFDNLRKIILYLMSDAFEGIIAVLGTIILSMHPAFSLPLPVSAAQILWINLVSDGFPHLALTLDPKSPDIMTRRPRSTKEELVNHWMKLLIGIVSGVGGAMALFIYVYTYQTTGDLILARSITFATLGINSLIYVFSVRTLTSPFWVENPFANKWLNRAVFAGLVFQVAPFLIPQMRTFLNLEPLSLWNWMYVLSASLIMFMTIEIMKLLFRRHLIRATS